MSFPPLPMEQTYTSHLFSQALSMKEQRLAFRQAPEAPQTSPEGTPMIQPEREAQLRTTQLASRLPEGKEKQQQSWKNIRSVLEKSFGAPSTVQGDSAHSIVLMLEEAANISSCPVYLKDGTLYERQESVFIGARMPHQSTYFTRPLVPHFDALFLVNPATAIDTLSKVKVESIRPVVSDFDPLILVNPASAVINNLSKSIAEGIRPDTRIFIDALASASKRDMEVVPGDIPVINPEKRNEAPAPAPASAPAPAPAPEAPRPEASPEVSIDDLKTDIAELNKETDAQKFKEKLEALNKKIEEKTKDKKPDEKAKVLEKVKGEIKNDKFKVKVEQKLVIDEPKASDVKPPILDQKESMQSFVKDLIQAIKEFMKEFGLTKEDLKGIITNKPNAPTALTAGNTTAEQLGKAKDAEATKIAELEKRIQKLESSPSGRAERVPNERATLEGQLRAERLVYERLVREEKIRLELERRNQDLARRTDAESRKYGVHTTVTMDRAGIQMHSVSDQGASTLRTIEQMTSRGFPGRFVRTATDTVAVNFAYAPYNSGNINVGGVQQVFENGLASAYEKAPATIPSAPAPKVEAPAPAPRVTPPPAPKPPVTRSTPPAGSLE